MMEHIILSNIDGISRLSGTDTNGNTWTQFEVDYLAAQDDGMCSICAATLTDGWVCLDGGEEICSSHVILPSAIWYYRSARHTQHVYRSNVCN